jgi:AcrR family transcriptional regulator
MAHSTGTTPVPSSRTQLRALPARAPMTKLLVITTAADIADAEGLAALTLTRVAQELDCHVTSLRNHVATIKELHRQVALLYLNELADQLWESALGTTGEPALRAVAGVYRRNAEEHRGRIDVMYFCQSRSDPEFVDAQARVVQPIRAILGSFGLDERAVVHAHRAFTCAVRGFVQSEADGLFAGEDADESFEAILELFLGALKDGGWLRPRPAEEPESIGGASIQRSKPQGRVGFRPAVPPNGLSPGDAAKRK